LTDLFLVALGAKMAISAAVVIVAAIMAERMGPLIGATFATFPWASGPAYVFLATDHDAAFIAKSALVSLVVTAANLLFSITYTALAQRWGALLSVAAALSAWLGAAILLMQVEWSLAAALLMNLAVFLACLWAVRPYRKGRAVQPNWPRWWELPLRGGAIAAIVGAVVVLGRELGPTAAGIASMAPVLLTSLAFILHYRVGAGGSAAVISNTIPGMFGFVLWLLTLHLAVVPLGRTAGIATAIAACCAWNVLMLLAWRAWDRRAGT
jgi:hypothetical protein